MKRHIKVLDCTLRDGGNALEDMYLDYGKRFSFENKKKEFLNEVSNAAIDIVELGVVGPDGTGKKDFSYYETFEELDDFVSEFRKNESMYVIGMNVHPEWIDHIPECTSESCCKGIRVYLTYSRLEESLRFSNMLSEKGYKVFLQNALTARYSDSDLNLLIDYANQMNAYAVYIVDSNGYLFPKDIERIYNVLDKGLNGSISIGFHPHNNLELAFSNAIFFLEQSENRPVIIDSCVCGMGRGAGNLKTEMIIPYINEVYEGRYDFYHIVKSANAILEFQNHNIWGYSIDTVLSAIHRTTDKYCKQLKLKHNYSQEDINAIISTITENERYRYTDDNLDAIIARYKCMKE